MTTYLVLTFIVVDCVIDCNAEVHTYSVRIHRLRAIYVYPNHVASIADCTGSSISTVSIDLQIETLFLARLFLHFDTFIDIYHVRSLWQRCSLPRWFLACGFAGAGREVWRRVVVSLDDSHLIVNETFKNILSMIYLFRAVESVMRSFP